MAPSVFRLSVLSILVTTSLVLALPRYAQLPLLNTAELTLSDNSKSSSGRNNVDDSDQGSEYIATFGASHLSEWCALSKQHFLQDLKHEKAHDWVVVTGNEAGDLDSLVSAISLAYDLAHQKHVRQKAVALLQVENSAIDLRPENKLALEKSGMESGHRDLLVLEDLPFTPNRVGSLVKGLILVDHNVPLSYWGNATVLGIVDQGTNVTADPRVIEAAGSTTSLVTSLILDHKHAHGPLPRSLGDLILSTIAIDTKGLEKGKAVDHDAAQAIFKYSHYAEENMTEIIHDLGKELKKAKKDLDHLSVWQLIQRDWKGDIVLDSTIPIHLGFASIPYSFQHLIDKTPNKTVENFFEIENDWARYNKVDIAVLLTSYKDENKNKRRDVILTVRSEHRIDSAEAERLFTDAKRELEASEDLVLEPWGGGQDLGRWRAAWVHSREDGGRKIVRPLVEKAVKHW